MNQFCDNTNLLRIKETSQSVLPSSQPTAAIEQTASFVFEKFSERIKTLLNGREQRGLKLALGGHVQHKSQRIYSVRSENNLHAYLVDLESKSCTCPDSRKGYICKHRIAAYLIEQSNLAVNSTHPQVSNSDPGQGKGSQEDERLDIAKAILNARSQFLREAIIYARIPHGGDYLKVEVLNLGDEKATVRALPQIKNGTELVPQFPFQAGQSSLDIVLASSLLDISIYR